MMSVGIVGASGYMGGEALRVLLRHPHADVAWATSRSPGPIEQVHIGNDTSLAPRMIQLIDASKDSHGQICINLPIY
jgi:N-acetyl-gamma-glutamylphosphate reductase